MIFSNLYQNNVLYHDKLKGILDTYFLRKMYSNSVDHQGVLAIFTVHKEELKFENFKPNLDTRAVNINFGTTFIGDVFGSKSLIKQKVEMNVGDYYSHLRDKTISLYKPTGRGIVVKKGSKMLAEYFPSLNTINILIDMEDFASKYVLFQNFSDAVFSSYGDQILRELLSHIGTELKDIIALEETKRAIIQRSWKSGNVETIQSLQASLEREATNTIAEHSRKIDENESRILDMRSKLAFSLREVNKLRKEIDLYETNRDFAKDKLVKELNLIKDFGLIEDVSIDGTNLSVITKYIPIKIDNTIYAGNAYIIKIDINSIYLEITSAINLGYKGYWTSKDPHPHVSSSASSQCLGNLSEILAELCSQRELYALIVMLIEFLKTANMGDVAGKKVLNHPVLTEEKLEKILASYEMGDLGDLFEFTSDVEIRCEHCGSTHEIEMMIGAFTSDDEPIHICQNCTDFIDDDSIYYPDGVYHGDDDEEHIYEDDEDEEQF